MKNPTGVDIPMSDTHGADSTMQYSMTTNEIALQAILSNRLGIKVSEYVLMSLKEDINSKFGSSI